jgi:hypothetical protein
LPEGENVLEFPKLPEFGQFTRESHALGREKQAVHHQRYRGHVMNARLKGRWLEPDGTRARHRLPRLKVKRT